jgi:ABC-2 type transport system permease protein
MSARRIRAVFLKEGRHIVRDIRSLLMALGMPVLLLVLFGYALSLDVDRIPTLIYDADGSPASRELIARFQGSRFFEIRGYVDGYREIEREIDAGRVLIGLAIPRDFSGRAVVQILLDGSDSNTAAIARGYAETVIRSYRRAGQRVRPPIDARVRIWYNSTLQSKNYVVPGLIGVILMIISALLTSLTIAREWETGTMEQLLSTPVRPAELVLGKMLAFFIVGVIDTLVAVLVGVFVFDVPLRGSILLLGVTSGLFLVGSLFWGILISAIAKTQLLAFQMGILSSFLPAFLLSGFIYATENMPMVIRTITYAIPTRYFITILKGIFLKGVGIEALWLQVLLLAIWTVIVFVLATNKLKAKLA